MVNASLPSRPRPEPRHRKLRPHAMREVEKPKEPEIRRNPGEFTSVTVPFVPQPGAGAALSILVPASKHRRNPRAAGILDKPRSPGAERRRSSPLRAFAGCHPRAATPGPIGLPCLLPNAASGGHQTSRNRRNPRAAGIMGKSGIIVGRTNPVPDSDGAAMRRLAPRAVVVAGRCDMVGDRRHRPWAGHREAKR
jgi:hypothetical protein